VYVCWYARGRECPCGGLLVSLASVLLVGLYKKASKHSLRVIACAFAWAFMCICIYAFEHAWHKRVKQALVACHCMCLCLGTYVYMNMDGTKIVSKHSLRVTACAFAWTFICIYVYVFMNMDGAKMQHGSVRAWMAGKA
jgi:hypothetical protein